MTELPGAAGRRREQKLSEGLGRVADMDAMTIDCTTCAVRGPACEGCVVSVLLGPPEERLELDETERGALDALAGGGLLPPLRLTPVNPGGDDRRRRSG